MDPKLLAEMARDDRNFLDNVLKAVPEGKDDYTPFPGGLTLAQQIAHIGKTTEWFREGLFGSGFNMDFEALFKEMLQPVTLAEARKILEETWDPYIAAIESATPEYLAEILPADTALFGGLPRWRGLMGNTDHVAHHRGAISVYLRGMGITPPVPYMV
ncbi:MAG: DinB family protein [Candidatus Sumerlaeia bacterium]|nr:DinB family protein [Candidatus Sumerlaeia bacterium]